LDIVEQYKCNASHPTHKASSPGILSIDIHPLKPELIVTGGVDKTAVIFNTSTSKNSNTFRT